MMGCAGACSVSTARVMIIVTVSGRGADNCQPASHEGSRKCYPPIVPSEGLGEFEALEMAEDFNIFLINRV